MGRKNHLIVGLLGLAIFALGVTRVWSGVQYQANGIAGYDLFAGKAAMAMAFLAAILLLVKPKMVAIPGVLILACTVFAFLVPKTEQHTPQLGIYISAVGGLILIISSFLVPIPHPRR